MTLETWQEEDILQRLKRVEFLLERLEAICLEILDDVSPQYEPTSGIEIALDS